LGRNIVVCLDGTGGQVDASGSSNVVRLFEMLDLGDRNEQIAYYDPGVGTFSSYEAWTTAPRRAAKLLGLATGIGMRENLAEVYTFLLQNWHPEDRLYLFGFSRGAYTARALTGLLYRVGVLRPGSENLVQYAVSAYARNKRRWSEEDWDQIDRFARAFSVRHGKSLAVPVEFLGIWDTVKAAGVLRRDLKWPYTRQLPNARRIWHAVSLDERRRPFREYLVEPGPAGTNLNEVWFAGVHSDIGGTFRDEWRLADVALKWMADGAIAAGLRVRPESYRKTCALEKGHAAGKIHRAGLPWHTLVLRQRSVPAGARVHASVRDRIAVDDRYSRRLPAGAVWEDTQWLTPRI
jgi:uncharacterized protein (DUF2235 family)